jgi:hypothetical protein
MEKTAPSERDDDHCMSLIPDVFSGLEQFARLQTDLGPLSNIGSQKELTFRNSHMPLINSINRGPCLVFCMRAGVLDGLV